MRWIIRKDFYEVNNRKFYFRIDKTDMSVKMFEINVSTAKISITNVGFVSDCFTNLEAKYSRLIQKMGFKNKLVSREYIFKH